MMAAEIVDRMARRRLRLGAYLNEVNRTDGRCGLGAVVDVLQHIDRDQQALLAAQAGRIIQLEGLVHASLLHLRSDERAEDYQRTAEAALAAATGTAKTAQPVECEASQSGGEAATPTPNLANNNQGDAR